MIAALDQHSTQLRSGSLLVAALVVGALVGVSTAMGLFWLPLVIAGAVAGSALVVARPAVWLYSVACILPVFFATSDEGVSALDVIFGAYMLGSLGIWLVRRVLWDPRPLIENWLDIIVILYFAYTSFNVFAAVAHGTDPFNWLRQYTLGTLVLYFFPLREHIKTWKELRILTIILSLVMVSLTMKSLNDFRSVVRASEYAYQITGRRLVPQAYLMSSLAAFTFLIYKPLQWRRIWAMGLSLLLLMGLISTYARTTWLAFILCTCLSLFFLAGHQRKRIVTVLTLFAVVSVIGATAFFGRTTPIIAQVIANRFLSSKNYKKDPALGNRVYESRAVARLIEHNPIAGYGLATPYEDYDGYLGATSRGTYIHNGVLAPIYSFGAVGAILQYLVLIIAFGRGLLVTRRCRTDRARLIALVSTMSILGMFLENFTAAAFLFRCVVFVLAYSFAGLSIAERFEREERLCARS